MYCEKKHVSLPELKEDNKLKEDNIYLGMEDIPRYPEYVFEEENVCHVTELSGLKGIIEDGGFRRGNNDCFLWWGLSVPRQSLNNMPFQEEFATSLAFQTKSFYGNFRFTFRLTELLREYSKFCKKSSPILRVFDTKVYKKEIVYTILVHPRYIRCYRKYPRLPINDEQVSGYGHKKIYWRCQSPSANYKYCLNVNAEDGQEYASKLNAEKYFVWDNVVVVFYMRQNWVLRFNPKRLFENLSVCETASNCLLKEPKMSLKEAEAEVRRLKKMYL